MTEETTRMHKSRAPSSRTLTPRAQSTLSRTATAVQKAVWSRRVSSWEHHGALVVQPVVDEILLRTPAGPGRTVLDIGCGTGTLALPLARQGTTVTAVDVSPAMIEVVRKEAEAEGLTTLTLIADSAERLSCPRASLDAVVSNYALHHLRDPDKARLVDVAAGWLKPGGILVIGDMMFGRGATAEDREIIAGKVVALLRKGPGGWWRVVKNVFRFLLRFQERPLSADRWARLLEESGLVDVQSQSVVAEASIVWGTRPAVGGSPPS